MTEYKPNWIYKLIRFPYRVLFVNTKQLFKPIGFFQKTKLDIYDITGREDCLVNYNKLKFHNHGWQILLEDNGYELLSNLDCVLDLGGYIGDSALILSQRNKEVVVFEPEKDKFKWILINIRLNNLQSRIIPYNYAVVSDDVFSMNIHKKGNVGGRSSLIKEFSLESDETEVVKCLNISKVMKLKEFDGLKCDIEGGEFSIINYFLKHEDKFKFKKGIIEFHLFKKEYQYNIIYKFIQFLKQNNYGFYFYNSNELNKKISPEIILNKIKKDYFSVMLYFTKKKQDESN